MQIRGRGWFVASSLCLVWTAQAHAAGPLPGQGQPISTSAYTVDMFQGPVLASSRVTGLSGAYAAIAEGVDGYPVNAAAPAVRQPWSVDHIDYDLSAGATFPGGLRETDFDNNGSRGFAYDNFVFLTLGANLQVGAWGFGTSTDVQQYNLQQEVEVDGKKTYLRVQLGKTHVLLARSVADGQWVMGAGVRAAYLNLNGTERVDGGGETIDLFSMYGAGLETGALWAPHGLPVRVGASFRSSVNGKAQPDSRTTPNADGDTIVSGIYLPADLVLPWEVEAGLAWQLGRRPLNVRWPDPQDEKRRYIEQLEKARNARRGRVGPRDPALEEREHERIAGAGAAVRAGLKARYRSIPRQKVLLSASALLSGPVRRGVGVESFLRQQVDRSGQKVSVTPRLGVEIEPLPNALQVRAGVYGEPSRFRAELWRIHATLGFDARLFEWSVLGVFDDDTAWRAGGFADVSRDYVSWGASVGFWH